MTPKAGREISYDYLGRCYVVQVWDICTHCKKDGLILSYKVDSDILADYVSKYGYQQEKLLLCYLRERLDPLQEFPVKCGSCNTETVLLQGILFWGLK